MEIIFEFIGGSRDGDVLCTDCDDFQERQQASSLAVITNRGEIGKRFRIATPYSLNSLAIGNADADEAATAVQRHTYEVAERLEEGIFLTVFCRFVPDASDES